MYRLIPGRIYDLYNFPQIVTPFLNDILHMSFLAGTHVFKAFPAYTTIEI